MTQPNDAIIERTRNELSRIAGCQRNSKRADRLIEWHFAALEAAGSESTPIVAETEARIERWLREMAAMPVDAGFNSAGKARRQILTMLADSIARRDHVTGEKDRG